MAKRSDPGLVGDGLVCDGLFCEESTAMGDSNPFGLPQADSSAMKPIRTAVTGKPRFNKPRSSGVYDAKPL